MKTSLKLACTALAMVATAVAGSALTIARAQAPSIAPKPVAVGAQQLNCGGETGFRIEVERPHDLQVSMSRPAGASGWNTMLVATGKVATLERTRPCGTSTTRVQVSADDADARSALQTCAIVGASIASGQKMILSLRLTEGARVGAGANSLLLSKPVQIDCAVE